MQTDLRNKNNSSEDRLAASDTRSERARRFFWGDDCFVSYARHDSDYALALADELTKQGLSCFLDQWGTPAGEELPQELVERLKRSTMLVVIGTEWAARSDNVRKEVVEFKKTGRPVIPITFIDEEDFSRIRNNEVPENLKGTLEGAFWYNEIVGIARTVESKARLKPGELDDRVHPSPQAVTRIVNAEGFQSRNKRLRRTFWTTLAALLTLLVAAGVIASVLIVKANQKVRKAQDDQATAELKARQADQDRTTAETARNSAIEARTKAERETQKAKDGLLVAQGDLEKASADLLTANKETQQEQAKAEIARREADKQQVIAGSYSLANRSSQELRQGPAFLSQSLEDALKSVQQFTSLQMQPLEADTALRESLAVFPKLQLTKQFTGRLRHARFSPDAKSFAIMDEDRAVQVYRTENTSEPIAIAGPSPEDHPLGLTRGDIALSDDLKRVAYIRPDLNQKVNNVIEHNYVEIKEIYGPGEWKIDVGPLSSDGFMSFTDIALSPDGKYLVFAVRDNRKEVIELWDIEQNRRLAYLDPPSSEKFFAISISFSPDGKTLVVGGAGAPGKDNQGRVLLWSDIDWEINQDSMQEYFNSQLKFLRTGTAAFYSISPSNDGEKFVLQYSTGGAGVWRPAASLENLEPVVHFPDRGFILATVFDPTGQGVSLIKDSGRESDSAAQTNSWCYESWEATGYTGLATIPYSRRIQSLHFTRDGSNVFGVSKDSIPQQDSIIIQKWSTTGGEARPEDNFKIEGADRFRPPYSTPGGKYIVIVNDTQVQVWDVERERRIMIPPEKDLTTGFMGVTLTPDAKLMAVAYKRENEVEQVHMIVVYEYERESDRFVKKYGPITVGDGPREASLSADGAYMAVYSNDGVQVFDLPKQKEITSGFLSRYLDVSANQKIDAVRFSPKQGYVAISYERAGREVIRVLDVWDYSTNRKLTSLQAPDGVYGSFSPDANYLVARMGEHLLKIINLRNPQAAPKTIRLRSEIDNLVFGPKGQSLAVVDGYSINLIDLATGLTTASLQQDKRLTALAFSDDESYLATGGFRIDSQMPLLEGDVEVRVWPLKPELLIKEASNRLQLFNMSTNR